MEHGRPRASVGVVDVTVARRRQRCARRRGRRRCCASSGEPKKGGSPPGPPWQSRGGEEEDRTPRPCIANAALSQLTTPTTAGSLPNRTPRRRGIGMAERGPVAPLPATMPNIDDMHGAPMQRCCNRVPEPAALRRADQGVIRFSHCKESDYGLEGIEDRTEPEGRLRRRIAGQPALPVLREQGRRGRPERRRGAVPLHRRGRDRPRARPPRSSSRRWATRPPACRSARSRQNLAAAVAGETHEYTDMYPGMAKTARDEGFDEIADWFETLAKAERSHATATRRRWTHWWTETDRPQPGQGPAPLVLRLASQASPCAKATSKLRPGTRSTGEPPSSTTRPTRSEEMERCSTSATAAAAA